MIRYVTRRLLMLIPTILIISFITFMMTHLAPGDPARLMAGMEATQQDVERIRKQLGLDKPLLQQYSIYLSKLFRGDMGTSIRSRRPVVQMIVERYPFTLYLALTGITIALIISLIAGTLAAVYNNTIFDNLTMTLAIGGVSMASFWRGLMLMFLFSLVLGWLPASGAGESISFFDNIRYLILPGVTLGIGSAAYLTRLTRSNMLEVLNEDYVTTARAKGLAEWRVIFKHSLRNALLPIITMAGLQFGILLGGTVVIEKVFAWPGIGRLTVNSIFAKDFPVVQGCIMTYAISFVLLNLFVDILYTYINPKIRY